MGCSSSTESELQQDAPQQKQHADVPSLTQSAPQPQSSPHSSKNTTKPPTATATATAPATTSTTPTNTTKAKLKPPAAEARTASQVKVDARLALIQPNDDVGRLLKAVPLLSKLSDAERAKLGGAVIERTFQDRQHIITQGEPGHGFFIIRKGTVAVSRVNESGHRQELATLKDGDVFGEAALINDAKRGATVTSLGPVSTFYLERDDFDVLFGRSRLNVQFAKRQAISAEQVKSASGAAASTSAPPNAIRDKDHAAVHMISMVMRDNVVFMNLDAENKAQIIAEMWRSEVKAGTAAVKQGDLGDCLYVIASGEFDVYVNERRVAVRGKGTMFGELALMYNSPRAATVVANQDSVVWMIDRFTFRRIVTGLSVQKFDVYVKFLKNVQLLAPLADYERKKIAEALEEVSFAAGHTVFKQGMEGDAMYIVYQGEVKILKDDAEVMRCRVGDHFGERSLLLSSSVTSEPRAATAITTSPVQLLKLDRNAFSLLLGPLEDIMKSNAQKYESQGINGHRDSDDFTPEEVHRKQTAALARARAMPQIQFSNLKVLGTLGKGSFGFVQLVQDRTTEATYALKAVSKTQIVQTGQQGHVMSEKKAMMMFDHPFLIKLHATYKDRNRLYFLLEPSLGGELFSVLRERTLFDEDTARFYAASVLIAFEYMHSLQVWDNTSARRRGQDRWLWRCWKI